MKSAIDHVLAVTIDGDSAVAVLRDAATWLEDNPDWEALDVALGVDHDGTFLVLYAERAQPVPGRKTP